MSAINAEQACNQELVSLTLYGVSNSMISRKLLIHLIWGIEQKMFFFFYHIINICEEHAITIFDRSSVIRMKKSKIEITTQHGYWLLKYCLKQRNVYLKII